MVRKECLENIRKGMASLSELLDDLIGVCDESQHVVPATERDYTEWPAMKLEDPEVKLEDVRAVLAEKSSTGHRAQVKAILNLQGVDKLSELDVEVYPLVMKQGLKIELFEEICRTLEAQKANGFEASLPALFGHHHATGLENLCPDYYESFLRDLKELNHDE